MPAGRSRRGTYDLLACRFVAHLHEPVRIPACNWNDVPPVLPISVSVHGKGLHCRLRGYKDAAAEAERRERSLDLAVLLSLFLDRHGDCLGGIPDVVVTVPSTDRDALGAVTDRIPTLRGRHLGVLRAVGSMAERRYEPDDGASKRVAGRRILLLDDTFTSGRSVAAAHTARNTPTMPTAQLIGAVRSAPSAATPAPTPRTVPASQPK